MAKPKPVNWQLIENGDELYGFVQDLIDKFHGSDKDIGGVGINFVLMWRHNVKMDADGYVVLADVTKSSDQNRELRPHDVIIGINKDAWSVLDAQQQSVVIDAQLERIAVCLDKDDNPKEDDRSRTVFRLRRIEVMDEPTLDRRHGMTLKQVQEYIHDQFETGGAEEGSHVAEVLSGDDD
jgi:hypothetical protein